MQVIIEARVRDHLKRAGMQVQDSFLRNLDKLVMAIIADAVNRAKQENRKRVLVRDLPLQHLLENAPPDRFYPTRSYIPTRPGQMVLYNRRRAEPTEGE